MVGFKKIISYVCNLCVLLLSSTIVCFWDDLPGIPVIRRHPVSSLLYAVLRCERPLLNPLVPSVLYIGHLVKTLISV